MARPRVYLDVDIDGWRDKYNLACEFVKATNLRSAGAQGRREAAAVAHAGWFTVAALHGPKRQTSFPSEDTVLAATTSRIWGAARRSA